MSAISRVVRFAGVVLALGVAGYALTYLRPGFPGPFEPQLPVFRARPLWFVLHVAGGAVALALVPFQVWARLRRRFPGWHRNAGRTACAAILLSALGGFLLAFTSYGGVVNTSGFATLAALWAGSTVLGVRAVRRGDLPAHRAWMLRVLALTFAAVTLRLWLPLLSPLVGFDAAYGVMGWLCWVPNLLAAEVWLRRARAPRRATPRAVRATVRA